ncbi:MAG: hypothetical protein WBB72_06535 [Methyloceanibacter sp.]
MTILVAALALVLVAFTPDLASAGHGHGGGHGWHGHRGWYGYRGWRGYGWGGWWGPASTSMLVATAVAAGLRPTAITPAAIATAGGIRAEIL